MRPLRRVFDQLDMSQDCVVSSKGIGECLLANLA
jgi:hypothetical protein